MLMDKRGYFKCGKKDNSMYFDKDEFEENLEFINKTFKENWEKTTKLKEESEILKKDNANLEYNLSEAYVLIDEQTKTIRNLEVQCTK